MFEFRLSVSVQLLCVSIWRIWFLSLVTVGWGLALGILLIVSCSSVFYFFSLLSVFLCDLMILCSGMPWFLCLSLFCIHGRILLLIIRNLQRFWSPRKYNLPLFHSFPLYVAWSDGTRCLVFWMLSFKAAFSLSSFMLIGRLFSSSSLSAMRLVASA